VSRPREVVVDCHIEDVFAFLADLSKAPRWATGVLLVRQVAGEGPGPDAAYEVVRRVRGRRRHARVVCAAHEPPHRVAWLGDGVDVTYRREPVWTATRVTAHGAALRDLRGLRRALEGR
jgi:hypothetical protein